MHASLLLALAGVQCLGWTIPYHTGYEYDAHARCNRTRLYQDSAVQLHPGPLDPTQAPFLPTNKAMTSSVSKILSVLAVCLSSLFASWEVQQAAYILGAFVGCW